METRVVRGVDVVRLAASLGVRFARTQVTPRSSAPNETHVSGQMYQMALSVRSKVASSLRRHKRLNIKELMQRCLQSKHSAERRNTYVIGERNHTRTGAVELLVNLHHCCDLRSQRVNGGTATWASSSRLRGYCDHPKAFLTGHMKLWMALTRRRLSQSAETLDGRPETTMERAQLTRSS